MSVSEAQKKAIAKYEAEKIERVTLRLQKGTTDKIKATGAKSINGFITDAIDEKLERDSTYQPTLDTDS